MPWVSRPGGDLCVARRWPGRTARPQVRNLLARRAWARATSTAWTSGGTPTASSSATPRPRATSRRRAGSTGRTELSTCGRTEEPTHLFEIGIDGTGLRQLTARRVERPRPDLPAQRRHRLRLRALRLLAPVQRDTTRTRRRCNLYVMQPDGSNIRRLSVNKDGDYLPHASTTARSATRAGNTRSGAGPTSSRSGPSGPTAPGPTPSSSSTSTIPGPWRTSARSPARNASWWPSPPATTRWPAGPVVVIDPQRGINEPAGIRIVTPGVLPPEGGMSGTPRARGRRAGRRRLLHDPLAALGDNASWSPTYLDTATGMTRDRPGRLRALPDRRLRHQGTDLPRPGDLLLHADPAAAASAAAGPARRDRPDEALRRLRRCSDVGHGVPGIDRRADPLPPHRRAASPGPTTTATAASATSRTSSRR